VQPRRRDERPIRAVAFALGSVGACLVWFALADHEGLLRPLALLLTASALIANVASGRWKGPIEASGSFTASMLAVAYLGPAPAFMVAVAAEAGTWLIRPSRPLFAASNVVASGMPNLAAATAFAAWAPADHASTEFYALLAALAAGALALNVALISVQAALYEGGEALPSPSDYAQMVPALAINVLLTVGAAGIYEKLGIGGALFVLASIFSYTYMARLVVAARERTRQYASLSWGVLSGLLRTLDIRDARAARHAAGVAAFSRDIAEAVGMRAEECELAHTAGLLHDIGRFGLSDRVMERGRTLTEQDWESIRRHPAMGADLLRDLGIYGPVAEIVRAHHERIDGRGYPDGLGADEIPEIAKIVAVAEVYDTLTADDTYRTPVSSFEALNELRRVSGSQLDERYVEVLAELLAGRGVDYRHANRADFDEELDVERRINEAVDAQDAAAQQ
jgi:putative nucleotidyltransferase with HDIG domain